MRPYFIVFIAVVSVGVGMLCLGMIMFFHKPTIVRMPSSSSQTTNGDGAAEGLVRIAPRLAALNCFRASP